MEEDNIQAHAKPLCVFTLSPPFAVKEFTRPFVQPTSRRHATPHWRRNDYSLLRTQTRFKPFRQPSHILAKYLTVRLKNRQSGTLTLQDVLSTVQPVWTSPNSLFKRSSSPNMEDRFIKKSSAPTDISSPVLLRRRLSAPETIMRKHVLAQQRSYSQDSDVTQSDLRSCQWRMETGIGSDPNLNKKRDQGLMRKSTLMRRLWGSNKPLSERSSRLSGSYSDWHYGKLSQGRSTQSLGSSHSSPEHLKYRSKISLNNEEIQKKYDRPNSNTKISLKNHQEGNQIYKDQIATKHKIFVSNGNLDTQSHSLKSSCCSNYPYDKSTSSMDSRLSTTKSSSTMTTTENDCEHYSTRSTSTGTTAFSDNSDSAYTNSNSYFTSHENSTTYSSEKFLEENGNNVENDDCNKYINLKESLVVDNKHMIFDQLNDSSTQTTDTPNLNVISNVQLSQSTLNLIFNQVMQDAQKSSSANINISTVSATVPLQSSSTNSATPQPQLIQVQQAPSFYLKQKQEEEVSNHAHNRILKCMVTNIGTGSLYSKPSEIPQVVVPRFSALPRTTSMEVNASSMDSTDKDSDNISLVDSLEDPSSPRVDINQNTRHDNKPVRGDISPLLPDNSTNKISKSTNKPAVFFIPIQSTIDTDIKAVADHLPEKVRERLSKRHLKREQKFRQSKDKIISPKSDSNYVSASDNGNQLHYTMDNAKYTNSASNVLPDINSYKSKRKSKPMLPSIESFRKIKGDSKGNSDKLKENMNKSVKRKTITQSQESTFVNEKKQTQWISKARHKILERLTPLGSNTNEYPYESLSKRIYHKTELTNLNKRIEILEIVECIDTPTENRIHRLSKSKKSKIPVLVNSKLPNISKDEKIQKPVFLDFDQMPEIEPKIDQLIANILIDALNKAEPQINIGEERERIPSNFPFVTEKRPSPTPQSPQMRHYNSKYQQIFAAIPEELTTSFQSSSEDTPNSESKNNHPQDMSKILQQQSSSLQKSLPVGPSTNKQNASNDYKGKAAVIKDDNFSTIPKGWITFYTLHKSQGSPESTSDEGKKKGMEYENTNYKGILRDGTEKWKKRDNTSEDNLLNNNEIGDVKSAVEVNLTQHNGVSPEYSSCVIPRKETHISQDSVDIWTSSDQEKYTNIYNPLLSHGYAHRNRHKKGRLKKSETVQSHRTMSGGWSVTVSGTTGEGQTAPDVEMRLTFPRSHKTDISPKDCEASLRDNLSKQKRETSHIRTAQENKSKVAKHSSIQLPDIASNRLTTKLRQCESSKLMNVKNYIEPRQTRTSTRRLLLNRPQTFATPAEFIEIDAEDYDFKEILKKFPDILKITGNTISPERKPRVPTMSERDVTKHIYRNT